MSTAAAFLVSLLTVATAAPTGAADDGSTARRGPPQGPPREGAGLVTPGVFAAPEARLRRVAPPARARAEAPASLTDVLESERVANALANAPEVEDAKAQVQALADGLAGDLTQVTGRVGTALTGLGDAARDGNPEPVAPEGPVVAAAADAGPADGSRAAQPLPDDALPAGIVRGTSERPHAIAGDEAVPAQGWPVFALLFGALGFVVFGLVCMVVALRSARSGARRRATEAGPTAPMHPSITAPGPHLDLVSSYPSHFAPTGALRTADSAAPYPTGLPLPRD